MTTALRGGMRAYQSTSTEQVDLKGGISGINNLNSLSSFPPIMSRPN